MRETVLYCGKYKHLLFIIGHDLLDFSIEMYPKEIINQEISIQRYDKIQSLISSLCCF